MVILVCILGGLCAVCMGLAAYFKTKEKRMIARLQDMIDCAVSGTFEDRHFDESGASLLENSMRRYICDNQQGYRELLEQKENLQKMVSDISHQAATPASGIILYAQLLAEELALLEGSGVGEAAEDVRPVSDQFSDGAVETTHPVSNQFMDEEKGTPADSAWHISAAEEEIHAILEQASQLDFFIRLLVKLSRMEKDLITVLPARQRIESVLQALREQYGAHAAEKRIELTVDNSQESAVFDRKWTIEAVGNIVDNAIKYTPEGGRISVKVRPYTIFLRLDVTDSGLGIREEEQGKIFTRFYRSETVHGEKGTGIGLYLAREIMEAQHGYIKVSSEAGKGSTFSLFFLKHELS